MSARRRSESARSSASSLCFTPANSRIVSMRSGGSTSTGTTRSRPIIATESASATAPSRTSESSVKKRASRRCESRGAERGTTQRIIPGVSLVYTPLALPAKSAFTVRGSPPVSGVKRMLRSGFRCSAFETGGANCIVSPLAPTRSASPRRTWRFEPNTRNPYNVSTANTRITPQDGDHEGGSGATSHCASAPVVTRRSRLKSLFLTGAVGMSTAYAL